jgi:hypothetical protein
VSRLATVALAGVCLYLSWLFDLPIPGGVW